MRLSISWLRSSACRAGAMSGSGVSGLYSTHTASSDRCSWYTVFFEWLGPVEMALTATAPVALASSTSGTGLTMEQPGRTTAAVARTRSFRDDMGGVPLGGARSGDGAEGA